MHGMLQSIRNHYRQRKARKKAPNLVELPLDVLCLIIDVLPLCGRVMFSQTCKSMRLLLGQECASMVKNLPPNARLDLLATFANVLPGVALCVKCKQLHKFYRHDLPSRPYDFYTRNSCPLAGTYSTDHEFGFCYYIAYRHVQLAIKYTRLSAVKPWYMTKLLAPYHLKGYTNDKILKVTYDARPKIVNGRFLLFSCWKYSPNERAVDISTIPRCTYFCPHLRLVGNASARARTNALTAAVYMSLESPKVWINGSCDRCPTDYRVDTRESTLTIWFWQDFGTGISPTDRTWKSHIWGPENGENGPLAVTHEAGRIRRDYEG